jgi:hypothetical protein
MAKKRKTHTRAKAPKPSVEASEPKAEPPTGKQNLPAVVKKSMPVEIATTVLAQLLSQTIDLRGAFHVASLLRGSAEHEREIRQGQIELLRSLSQAGIDPQLFDLVVSNELDRTLKKQFGNAFLAATLAFTAVSFAVIIFNSIYRWGISDMAITALIVEVPLQFIGLLFIIARNLFPQPAEHPKGRAKQTNLRQREQRR